MIGLVLLLLGGTPMRPSVITQPQWDVRPTSEDLEAAYPPDAQAAGIEGHVTLVCVVTRIGTLDDCAVVEETPSGHGFGAAALLGVTPKMRMHPQTVDGAPVGGAKVRIPLNFKLSEPELASPGFDMSETCVGVAQAALGADVQSRREYLFWYEGFVAGAAAAKVKPSEIARRLEAARVAAVATLGTAQGRDMREACRRVEAVVEEAPVKP